jgi:hypothetical protein
MYLGIKLTKDMKDHYNEKCKTLKKEMDEDTRNERRFEKTSMFMNW